MPLIVLTMPLIVLHVGELLKKVGDRQPLKIGRIGLSSSVYEVTLPTRGVGALLTRNYRSRRRRVQLRKPIDRAGAPINLCVRVALRAPGNTELLAIVRFRRLVHTLRVRPIRIVSPCEVSWWIGALLRCCLVRMSQNVYGEKDAACRHGEQRKQRSLIHANILTDMRPEYLSILRSKFVPEISSVAVTGVRG